MFQLNLPTTPAEQIENLRRDMAENVALAVAAEAFLLEAFPQVQPETVFNLASAWLKWINGGGEDEIRVLEKLPPAPPIPTPLPFSHQQQQDDYLVRLCTQRDQLANQIEQGEQAKEKMPIDGMREVIEATMLLPLRNQLENLETEISRLQRQMEQATPPSSTEETEHP